MPRCVLIRGTVQAGYRISCGVHGLIGEFGTAKKAGESWENHIARPAVWALEPAKSVVQEVAQQWQPQ